MYLNGEVREIDAVQSLVPGAKFVMSDNVITKWSSEETQPTEEEIANEKARLQAEYDTKNWERNRQSEYPGVLDCIHALLDGGDTLTDLQAARQAVKDKYPKG